MTERAVARRTDPGTSWAAANSISAERIRISQMVILDILCKYGPATDGQIWDCLNRPLFANYLRFSPSGARTRRKELVDKGLVKNSGETVLTTSRRKSIVWEAVEK